MPRIDPQKLLTCISVLLAPNGGIRSSGEVKRLASLMTKYSKKLVSKCIYIQILKCTETDLLGQFMSAGGWTLAHMWLTDGILSKNWPLVQELLELLLLCPVDVPRLQSNSAPKLVKGLSRDVGNEGVRILATKLVEQWLKIAKGETMTLSSHNAVNSITDVPVVQNSALAKKPIFIDQSPINDYQPEEDPLDIRHENGIEYSTGDETDSKLSSADCNEGLVYKLTVRDGKQILAKVSEVSPRKSLKATDSEESFDTSDKEKSKSSSGDKRLRDDKESSKSREHRDKEKSSKSSRDREKDRRSSDSSSHRSSSKSSKHNSSTSSDKDKLSSSKSSSGSSSHKSSSHKSSSSKSSSHKSSSSSSSRDKDKDRHKSSSSSSASKNSSSSKDKDKKEEETKAIQADKDKATLAKVIPQSISKMGKIPKKGSSAEDGQSENTPPPPKKSSISIEVRKDTENRPKTVKTFHSQFRSHGLAEEAPPPPSRKGLKKPNPIVASPAGTTVTSAVPVSSPTTLPKRSLSPTQAVKDITEKKVKLDSPIVEKPGAIKLIPPKPKPSLLVESDMFMDAISAATTKKESARKRKRLTSQSSKDDEKSASPSVKEMKESKSAAAPMKFYQDTLEESESRDSKVPEDVKNVSKKEIDETEDPIATKKSRKDGDETSDSETQNDAKSSDSAKKEADSSDDEKVVEKKQPGPGCGPDGPPGVLALHRKKGPKKSLKWRPQESLEEVRYFELDENERVNVTKTFVDMTQMERTSEREAFQTARKVSEDKMVEQTPWAKLIEIADVPELQLGSNSTEKDIQADREKTCLKTIYFNRGMIPDSPSEPDVVIYQIVEPQNMPLIDVTGNPDAIHDFTSMPWPEPKGSPPHSGSNIDVSDMPPFPSFNQFPPFGPPANNMAMGNMGAMGPMGPMNNMGPMGPMGPMGNMPIGPPRQMPPFNPMMGPPDMNPMPPFHGPNGGPPMGPNFGPNGPNFMNNFGPPMMNMNDNNNRGRNGPGNWGKPGNMNWQPPMGGGPPPNGRPNWINNNNNANRICKQFQRGYCRHGDRCKFLHPGVNCPPI